VTKQMDVEKIKKEENQKRYSKRCVNIYNLSWEETINQSIL